MTERRNQYGGNCKHCGQWVPAGDGLIRRRRDEATDEWKTDVVHEGACPNGEPAAPRAQAPLWAVQRRGRTLAGNEAEGYGLTGTHEPGAVPMNDAAHALDRVPRRTEGAK